MHNLDVVTKALVVAPLSLVTARNVNSVNFNTLLI